MTTQKGASAPFLVRDIQGRSVVGGQIFLQRVRRRSFDHLTIQQKPLRSRTRVDSNGSIARIYIDPASIAYIIGCLSVIHFDFVKIHSVRDQTSVASIEVNPPIDKVEVIILGQVRGDVLVDLYIRNEMLSVSLPTVTQ